MTDKKTKYQESVIARGYQNLVPLKTEPTIEELLKEGHALLNAESSPAKEGKAPEPAPGAPTNPYVRAREKVLSDLPKSRREKILAMESNNDISNKTYNEFIKHVTELGDKYSIWQYITTVLYCFRKH